MIAPVTTDAIDAVAIGTAVVSYIEPHPGAERAFNRWYELDHFYSAVMAGPGAFAGGRWVATRACKDVRPDGALFGDPARGTYLAAAWVLAGAQAGWDAWIAGQMDVLRAEDRLFPGRDHVHTAIYRLRSEVRAPNGPPAAVALDRCFPGIVALAVERAAAVDGWVGTLVGPDVPVAVVLTRERVAVTTLDDPDEHLLVLAFVEGEVLDVWRRVVAPALDDLPRVGFASPFLRTVPGTDTHVEAR